MLCIAVLSSASSTHTEVEYEWHLKRDRDGIQVYVSKVADSKFKAMRAQMVVETPVRSLVALITDLENCQKWAPTCKRAHIVTRLSPTESIVYSHNNLPFPVRDRVAYSRVVWTVDAHTGIVLMRSHALSDDQYHVRRGVIRVTDAMSEWRFTPQAEGRVLVESFVYADPNGAIPAWLTNLLMVDTPYDTMRQVRKLAQTEKYRQALVPFLP
ncbi:hypothetical protein GCM10008090_14970 [Arenicella chitinivorans]|uniref:START domain-containing protein n=2 Tax=Arenicella chitinivorans TaxID=1329800 RepID=A0A918RQG4_9GAMM|nr:hypothetical protein GCM10008090_14970 [Arenicella chitinivorans]